MFRLLFVVELRKVVGMSMVAWPLLLVVVVWIVSVMSVIVIVAVSNGPSEVMFSMREWMK